MHGERTAKPLLDGPAGITQGVAQHGRHRRGCQHHWHADGGIPAGSKGSTQRIAGHPARIAVEATAGTGEACGVQPALQRRSPTLAHHLQQSKARPTGDAAGAVVPGQRLLQRPHHPLALRTPPQRDEIHDDRPGQIAQPDMAPDGRRRFEVAGEGGGARRGGGGRAAVDVDGDQSLGLGDGDPAPRG